MTVYDQYGRPVSDDEIADAAIAGIQADQQANDVADGWPAGASAERPEHPAGRRLVATTADELTMKAPRWLYDWRIPTGAITLLAGREGIGKSTIAADLAARVTRGTLTGRHYGTPRNVAVAASEDAWESVILPRLVAADTDRSRVHRVEAIEDDHVETISVPLDLGALTQLCTENNHALIILDPLMSVIHGRLDTHKDREVRQALDPLARFAAKTGVAVLGLIHVNKTATTDPLTSIMASRAFAAVARSVLYCLLDPDADREDRYLFGHPKSNLGPKQPTLRYHLIEVKLEIDDDEEPVVPTSKVVWDGTDDRTVRDAMETPRTRADSETTVRILQWLASQHGAAKAADLAIAFSDIKRATLDKHLSRLVDAGKIARPFHGHYSLTPQSGTPPETARTPELPEAPDPRARGETPLPPELPVLPERLADLADLAEQAYFQVPERVPETQPDWADALYDRER